MQQADEAEYLKAHKQAAGAEYTKLTVIVIEEEGQFSRPERLIEVLSGVVALYENCARIEGVTSSHLTVLACDSGSDKSFDFLGFAKVMEQVKEIFIALWDRVVFYKEKKLSSQIEVVAQGLPVLAKLTELESTEILGREEAEIIRRGILDGCGRILRAGAIIPEIHAHSSHNPRVLMAAEKMLLMPPAEDVNHGTARGEPQPAAPIEEGASVESDRRIEQMERMIAELKAERNPPPKMRPRKAPPAQ